ncbi:MAG: FAD:protein FMN transferase [Treponema sp.]|jgi:thiamine biosynthesis lipoprotein|nr:FAD:protein FMN transferase [Treponema sp.]
MVFLPLGVLLAGCMAPTPAQAEFVLGTVCSINLYKQGSPAIYSEIFSRLREIEAAMSTNLTDTDIDTINKNAGIGPVPVHEAVIDVLERAIQYAELSGGAFDPTVGPLVRLWGIGTDHATVPEEADILAALSRINWRDMVIDRNAGTVLLRKPGMALDLGAIAKGYAADEVVRIIKQAKIPGAIIDLGGNVFAYGEKASGKPGSPTESWRIGIQNPVEERGTYIGILSVRNKSIVTSGVYERYLEADGMRYHHILSTENGYPIDNGLFSVTIVADHSIDADALSTTVFTLGYEKGRALIESLHTTAGNTIEAIFVFHDRSIRLTEGALPMFTLSSSAYQIAR